MGYGGFEMGFFWYAGYEFQKVGEKSGMRDWAPPPPLPPREGCPGAVDEDSTRSDCDSEVS